MRFTCENIGAKLLKQRLRSFAEFHQALVLVFCDRNDGAVSRRESTLGSGVFAELELVEVLRRAELVVTVHIAVVHESPVVAVDEAKDACSLHGFAGLLQCA